MTPQERQQIDELFDRLAGLERNPRDAEASIAIARGLERAPNSVYALVQTVLVQDEMLRRANARIEQLEGATGAEGGGFLDTMRDALLGRAQGRGSVPSVRPNGDAAAPLWNAGGARASQPMGYEPAPASSGGSFLGTAAAAAAGVIGGSLLLNSLRNLMGGPGQSFGDSGAMASEGGRAPWNADSSGNSLARDAGLDDIGRASQDGGGSRFSFLDAGGDQNGDGDDDWGGGTDSDDA